MKLTLQLVVVVLIAPTTFRDNLFKFTLYTILIYKVGDKRCHLRRYALIQHNVFYEIRTPTENKHASSLFRFSPSPFPLRNAWYSGYLGSQPGSCNQGLTVSCIVTQFARDSFVNCRFREREIDCLSFAFTKMLRKIRFESKWNTNFWVVSAENFWEQRNTWKGSPVFSGRNIPIGNSNSISSRSSLILVSGLCGRVSVSGTDFYKW